MSKRKINLPDQKQHTQYDAGAACMTNIGTMYDQPPGQSPEKIHLYQGNYLEHDSDSADGTVVTAIQWVGDLGECRAKVFPLRVFRDIDLKWFPFTIRGYGQMCELPRMVAVDMTDAVTRWNLRIPENGQFMLYATREERDSHLSPEKREELAAMDSPAADQPGLY